MELNDIPDINGNDSDEISFPEVGETPVSWGELNLQRADNYKAIVNPESGKVFSIVSNDYKLIRHEEEDLTDIVMSDIIKEAEDAGCEDPLAVANNLYNVGAIFKRDGEKRDPNREEILYMAEVGIFLLACQGTSTPGSLCDKCATEHLRTARKRTFKVLSSKSKRP